MCDTTVQYSDAGILVKLQEHLPLLPKFPDHLLGREVEIDLGGRQPIVVEEALLYVAVTAEVSRRHARS
jgi:hypothetical protein